MTATAEAPVSAEQIVVGARVETYSGRRFEILKVDAERRVVHYRIMNADALDLGTHFAGLERLLSVIKSVIR